MRRTPLVLGVDIGGTKVALMLAHARTGVPIAPVRRFETPERPPAEVLLEAVREQASDLAREAGRDPERIEAVGIAVPGQVDARGTVLHAGNLGWIRLPLRALARRRLGVPAFVEHDASAGALGEHWRGAARRFGSFVFLALGTGVGAGVMIDGVIHRGAHGFAGEVGDFILARGHLRRDERDAHMNLAALVGARAIRRRARTIAGHPLGAAEAIRRAQEDPALARLAATVVDYVAMTVINITALIDPEAIVFGGGTAEAGGDLIDRVRDRVTRELGDLVQPPRLLAAKLGEHAQLHGAVWGAIGVRLQGARFHAARKAAA